MYFAVLQQNYSSVLQDPRQHIEISIDALGILDNLTNRLTTCGGISTIIDYGHNGTKEDTFRAFYKHKLHDPLCDPGKVDLTVSFRLLLFMHVCKSRLLVYSTLLDSRLMLTFP